MKNPLPLTDRDGEVRELTGQDFARGTAFSALPPALQATLSNRKPSGRGPQIAPVKERINIRLSPDVLQAFRATGSGWQTRIDLALRDWLETHAPGVRAAKRLVALGGTLPEMPEVARRKPEPAQ